MLSNRQPFVAYVAAVALLVAGCSGGGGKKSAPTTVSETTTTTPVGGTGISDGAGPVGPPLTSHVVAILGPCPKVYPNGPPAHLNAGIKGLDKKMVPIASVKARVCRYGVAERLEYDDVLSKSAATQVEDATNRLLAVAPDYSPTCPSGIPLYLVTFASGSQRVVAIYNGCGVMTNGVRSAQADTKWLNELEGYAGRPVRRGACLNGPHGATC